MNQERRRYFRITETIGISYRPLDSQEHGEPPNVLDLVSEQDQLLEKLLIEVADTHPKVAELVTVFNQKLERVVNQLMVESNLVSRIAQKVREVNISACGIAFINDEYIPENTALSMELTLHPEQNKIQTSGRVISCEQDEEENYYLRIDFFGMSSAHQESLIQHIVRSQSSQIKELRG